MSKQTLHCNSETSVNWTRSNPTNVRTETWNLNYALQSTSQLMFSVKLSAVAFSRNDDVFFGFKLNATPVFFPSNILLSILNFLWAFALIARNQGTKKKSDLLKKLSVAAVSRHRDCEQGISMKSSPRPFKQRRLCVKRKRIGQEDSANSLITRSIYEQAPSWEFFSEILGSTITRTDSSGNTRSTSDINFEKYLKKKKRNPFCRSDLKRLMISELN